MKLQESDKPARLLILFFHFLLWSPIGSTYISDPKEIIPPDVFAYNLHYFEEDYTPIGYAGGGFNNPEADYHVTNAWNTAAKNLYNGNIRGLMASLSKFNNAEPLADCYLYDQLNRYNETKVFETFNTSSHDWDGCTSTISWTDKLTYEANGNIKTFKKRDSGGSLYDDMKYHYNALTNQLNKVEDNGLGAGADEIQDQSIDNYEYTENGNLKHDVQGGLRIYWTVYGKVAKVINSNIDESLRFMYDPMGNRVSKSVINNISHDSVVTYYIRDAQGNELCTYERTMDEVIKWKTVDLYGSSRLGMYKPDYVVYDPLVSPPNWQLVKNLPHEMVGKKEYELTNHLGNVMATISDKLIILSGGWGTSLGIADVLTEQDYRPFGEMMDGRTWTQTSAYKQGYQGSLKDDEIYGEGNSYSTFFRELDVRLGRWWSCDPATRGTPWESPYSSANDNPIFRIDIFGNTGTNWYENSTTGEIKWYDTDADADKANGKGNWKDLGKNVLVATHGRDANFKEPANSATFELYLESNKNGPTSTISGNTVSKDPTYYGTLKEGLYSADNWGEHANGTAIWINGGMAVPSVTYNHNNPANKNLDGTMKPLDQQIMDGILFHPGNPYQTNLSYSDGCQTGACGPGSKEQYAAFSKGLVGFHGNYYLRAPVVQIQTSQAVIPHYLFIPYVGIEDNTYVAPKVGPWLINSPFGN